MNANVQAPRRSLGVRHASENPARPFRPPRLPPSFPAPGCKDARPVRLKPPGYAARPGSADPAEAGWAAAPALPIACFGGWQTSLLLGFDANLSKYILNQLIKYATVWYPFTGSRGPSCVRLESSFWQSGGGARSGGEEVLGQGRRSLGTGGRLPRVRRRSWVMGGGNARSGGGGSLLPCERIPDS